MGANKNSNLQKCGEILIDINSKNRKNKMYIFHCIFCNMEFDQLKKFSLHIGEEHLNNLDDLLSQAVIKFEAEPEEILTQSYTDIEVPDIQVFDNSVVDMGNVSSDILETANPVNTVINHNINCKIKQEFKENSNDESNFYGWEVTDYVASADDSDKDSKGQLDSSFVVESGIKDEIKDDLDQMPQKKRKLNVAKKSQKLKQMRRTFKMSCEETKDTDSNMLDPIWKKMKMASYCGERKTLEGDKELVGADFSDGDIRKKTFFDENEKNRKLQNKIKSKRYREKRKMAAIANSQIPKQLTVEEQEIIKRRKKKDKLNSQRYRDKKRTTNLINLQIEHSSKAGLRNVSKCQNFNVTQTSTQNDSYIPDSHSPIITNYDSSTQNTVSNDVQNYTQNMDSQHFLLVQTYSSFQRNSCAHREFLKDFYENDFGHACDICDRLWFKKDLKMFVNNNSTPNIEFIRKMLSNVNVAEVKMCSTCYAKIKKNRVPPLSVYNGFKYPPLPENLKNRPLDFVTETLVSPRIPFMQIRRLRHVYGQLGIYGQVINVPIEVNTMVRTLPRTEDDDHLITVHLKKRKIHKSSYILGKVNTRNIQAWLQFLKDTPLYSSYGITVDDTFLGGQDHVHDEITYDEDEEGNTDISELIPIKESLIAQQQTLMWNKEMYLRIAPEEGNISFSLLFDEHAEELSFPQIYLGQLRTFRNGTTVTPFMMATSELRRSDRRGVTPQHLLYMAMKIMRMKILSAFKHVKKAVVPFSKEQIESENYIHDCIESNFAFLRMIPNSAYYWSESKKDLFAMIRQYGKPTVFFTINANEMEWPKLLQLLHKLKNNSEISIEDVEALHFIEKSTLINEDAVTCAIYFNQLVNVLMKILQSKRFSPFKNYRVSYYFKRIEFQDHGSPQAHILAWLDNAAENALGKDYNKAIELIDFLISVSAAEASGNIKLQTHKHTFTCYEGVASKGMQKCKFEAPFMPIKTTMILTPMNDNEDGFKEYKAKYIAIRNNLENYEYNDFQTFYEDNDISSEQEYVNIIRAGINRPKVFPKRQPYEKWHNPFNPFILNIVQSKTDIQFITEEYSCATYIAAYVNNSNRSISDLQRQIIQIMAEHPKFDIFEINKNISINLLNHTEITSQEAAWYLLREPFANSSINIIYIPTVWPIERQRIRKTMKELTEWKDDRTDIWKENWFDKYEKRFKDLENISLAQFVSKFLKNETRIIRYRNYDKATELNEYKREMVTLHIPFRHEESEILEEMNFIKIYDENVDLIMQKKKEFEFNIDIENILQMCREVSKTEISDDNDNE